MIPADPFIHACREVKATAIFAKTSCESIRKTLVEHPEYADVILANTRNKIFLAPTPTEAKP